VDEPIRTRAAMGANFTNELGIGGTVRFLKNVAGLWLLQECRRAWAGEGREYSFEALDAMARGPPALRCLVDPDDPGFSAFGDMPARVRAAAVRFGPAPEDDAQVARCIFDSLAVKYRVVLDELERLTGRSVRVVHMVGGGARDGFLCQLTADATGRPVRAGPVEATALGNVLVQALARGRLSSRAQVREVALASERPVVYEPRDGMRWSEALGRFMKLRPA